MKLNVNNGLGSVKFSVLGLKYFISSERRSGSRKPSQEAVCRNLNYCIMGTSSKLEINICNRRGFGFSLVFQDIVLSRSIQGKKNSSR